MKNFILISPYSKPLRNGEQNSKNYPYWAEVINGLKDDYRLVQIGVIGEIGLVDDFRRDLPLRVIGELLMNKDLHTWISVDNFLPHLAHVVGCKPGIVLWGPSDPNIFGYKENKNLLKARKYLRPDQFGVWESIKFNADAFVPASYVINAVKEM